MRILMVKFSYVIPVLALAWGLTASGCLGQVPVSPETRPDTLIVSPSFQASKEAEKDRELKSVITQIRDTSLAFDWFRFYNSEGRCVKTLRSERLESKHPIYKLDFPKSVSKGREYCDYYMPLEKVNYTTGELIPLVNRDEKIKKLQSLKKYGLVVKRPEKATNIVGNPETVYSDILAKVTQPAGIFLTRIENAVVVDAYDVLAVSRYDDLTANSLLDCAYVTIYNHLGDIYNEILIPDKLLRFAIVSNDGKYLLCESYNVIANETTGGYPETSYLVVDLEAKEINYLSKPEFRHSRAYDPLFADGYFQISYNTSTSTGQVCNRLFIDPYSRSFYLKTYRIDSYRDRKVVQNKSFMRYEGIKEDIGQFIKHSF